jgi:hypothetical protein
MTDNNRFELTCSECAMVSPMQPCEACPNWQVQLLQQPGWQPRPNHRDHDGR